MDDNPSIMSHVSAGVADMDRAAAFYDAVLATVGARRLFEEQGIVAYGRAFPEFGIGLPHDGGPPSPGNGVHFAFLARSRGEVDAFWEAALAHGGTGDGAPGLRPHYEAGYYACFVRDPDGNKVEAVIIEDAAAEAEAEAHPS